jgi:hypothetical protein
MVKNFHAMLVFATNQIKLIAFGGIRRAGHQPSGKFSFFFVIAEI